MGRKAESVFDLHKVLKSSFAVYSTLFGINVNSVEKLVFKQQLFEWTKKMRCGFHKCIGSTVHHKFNCVV